MKRRDFMAQSMAAAAFGPLLASTAHAQGAPVEGTHYVKLAQPVPVPADGKIDIVEFFSYACPHCNALEPTLEAWEKKLPADVRFHRIPVPFLFNPENFQRIYYTLETLNQVQALQRKVFYAVHVEHNRLDKPADIQAFMVKNGLDGAKFMEVFNSFAVQTKVRQAKQAVEAYKIDSVPALGIQGRYFTSVALAGGQERALAVVDWLAQQVRAGK